MQHLLRCEVSYPIQRLSCVFWVTLAHAGMYGTRSTRPGRGTWHWPLSTETSRQRWPWRVRPVVSCRDAPGVLGAWLQACCVTRQWHLQRSTRAAMTALSPTCSSGRRPSEEGVLDGVHRPCDPSHQGRQPVEAGGTRRHHQHPDALPAPLQGVPVAAVVQIDPRRPA